MKILMINKFFFIKGGAERYFFELKEILESKGHTVIPFSMKHPGNKQSAYANFFVENIDFNPVSLKDKVITGLRSVFRILYSRQSQKRLKRLIQDTHPDIAHLHMIDHQISPSILPVLNKAGIPVVQTVHTYKHVCPTYRLYHMQRGEICEKCINGAYYNALIEKCHRGSFFATLILVVEMYLHRWLRLYEKYVDLLIPPSHFMGSMLERGGFCASKIHHLFYTIQIDQFPYGLSTESYFVFYGRLSEEKGLMTLLKAMQRISIGRLKIIGEGSMRHSLEVFVNHHLQDRVVFTGALEGRKLKETVARSQFVVVPSEWYENSPLVIYESFAMGKPVIGAKIGGIPELIEHEVTGLLFTAGDVQALGASIQSLLSDPGKIQKYGKAARNKAVALFDPEIHYQKIMDLYENQISKKQTALS
ncbi:glycosyltransferase family 4 protein [bacterium]|nr:glycosyltransferase family 4 protein [bacterium]